MSATHESSVGQVNWSYALSCDDEVWRGACASREEAIEEGRSELADQRDPDQGTFWIDFGARPKAIEYVPDAESIVEMMGERAADNIGEISDDWPPYDKEAMAELDAFLALWSAKHFDPVRFWALSGKPEEIPFVEPMVSNGGDK